MSFDIPAPDSAGLGLEEPEDVFSGYQLKKRLVKPKDDSNSVMEHARSFENLIKQDMEKIELFGHLDERAGPH
jgi:hypothetical protein